MTTTDTKKPAAVPAQAAPVAPSPATPRKPTTQRKAAPKALKRANSGHRKASRPSAAPKAPRQGSKAARVVAMLRRKSGSSLSEIMKTANWQRHTIRGFVAGALKKAGYTVGSLRISEGRAHVSDRRVESEDAPSSPVRVGYRA